MSDVTRLLNWDQTGEKVYETGTDRGVLYPMSGTTYGNGVAWNGLTAVTESPSGAEPTDLYADNIKYVSLRSAEEFGGTIEAYTYPDEFGQCDGSADLAVGVSIGQQTRKAFGLSYRTKIGNDTDGNDHGSKIHLVYGATVSPSERGYATINDSPDAITFSWEFSTTPVAVEGFKPTAILTIDSTKVDPAKLASFEAILYGTAGSVSYTAVTPEVGDNPSTEGWYEKVGSTYVLTEDTTVDSEKTYYEKVVVSAVEARLPLPDEVARHFAAG